MFDEVKKEIKCKWCFHDMKFHVKQKNVFPQKKFRLKSYCESCHGLCKGKMIRNEGFVSQ